MKRLTSISARQLKGQSFDHKLAGVTLFSGRNFKGKTARIQAAQLALAGELPKAKTNAAIFELASGSELHVIATYNEGNATCRTWRKERGSVKAIATNELEFPLVAFNATEYLALSATERTKFLFARAKLPEQFTVEKLTETIVANVKNTILEKNTPESERAIAKLAEMIARVEPQPPQAWLETVAAEVKAAKLLADQNVKRLQATLAGLTQVAQDDAPPSPDAEFKLAAARTQLEAATANVARLRTLGETAKQELDAVQIKAALVVDETAARARMTAIETEHARLAKLTQIEPSPAEAQRERDLAQEQFNECNNTMKAMAHDVVALAGKLQAAQAEKTCPHCGQSVVKLKEKIVTQLEGQLKNAQELESAWMKKTDEASDRLAAAVKVLEPLLTARAEFAAAKIRFAELSAEHARLQVQLANNEAAATAAKQVPVIEATLADLRTQYAMAKDAETACRNVVAAADIQAKRLAAMRSEAATRANVIAEVEAHQINAAVAKAAVSGLVALQEQLVAATVEPLLATCNRLCGDVLRGPLQYVDGEIVLALPGGAKVRLLQPYCSGTEEALAHAALCIALAQDAPVRLVVLDELGRLDADNKRKLFALLCALQLNGEIDNALLVDTEPQHFTDDNFNCIEL